MAIPIKRDLTHALALNSPSIIDGQNKSPIGTFGFPSSHEFLVTQISALAWFFAKGRITKTHSQNQMAVTNIEIPMVNLKLVQPDSQFLLCTSIHPSIHPSIYLYIYIYTVYICICCTIGPCFCSCLAPCSPASCKCSPRHPHRSTRQCRRPTNPGTTELLARQALEKCGFPKIGIPPENSSKLSTSYDFHGFSINHPALGVFPLLKPPELILSPAPQLHQGTGKSCWYRTSQSPAATKDRSTA